jgi:hypothetical protein
MKLRRHYYIGVLLLCACCWHMTGMQTPVYAQMTSVVNSTADDVDSFPWDDPDTPDIDESIDGICKDNQGRCTLRAALEEAAARDEAANITFSVSGIIAVRTNGQLTDTFGPPSGSKIVGNGLVTIAGSGTFSFLMGLQDNTTIQGMNFYDATEALLVGGTGNLIGGNMNQDQDNTFNNMTQAAIDLIGDNNVVKGNFIGTDVNGSTGGNQFGIFLPNSSLNTIGGGQPGEGNVISGNHIGIGLAGDSIDGHLTVGKNVIIGNFIGTNKEGTQAIPNDFGIEVLYNHNVMIGGLLPQERNIISGNKAAGITLGINADTVNIWGNYIGTDVTGAIGVPNQVGIQLGPGSRNSRVYNNLISSNKLEGIEITGYEQMGIVSRDHIITGNNIVLNQRAGILISYNAIDNIIGSSLTNTLPANEIHYNGVTLGGGGIFITGYAGLGIPHGNTFRKNDFLDNSPRGIIFSRPPDVQAGIRAPVLRVYTVYGDGTALLQGTHHRPGSLIDVYSAGAVIGPTFQGRTWLASGYVDGNGDFAITMDSCTCSRLIATATDVAGNTSEFSRSFATRPGVLTPSHNSGANAQSVPVGTSGATNSLYPGATSQAYTWIGPTNIPGAHPSSASGSYISVDTLVSGVGYWIKFDSQGSDSLTGIIKTEDTVAVTAGWNLIGSISDHVSVSEIASIPGALVTSQFFGYTTSYQVADSILPGKSYWVKVNQSGSLILASPDGPPLDSLTLIAIVPDTAMPPPPPPEVLGNTTTAQLNLNSGWNMSSVPVIVSDFQTTSLFPGVTTNVFAYLNGSYAAQSTLANGLGYWVKYGSASMVSMTGATISSDTFDVALGWNLVGSISNPVLVSSIASIPGGLVTSPFFEYNLSYTSADTIQPGKAYWVKTTGSGKLILSSSGNTPSSNRIKLVSIDDLPPSPPDGAARVSDNSIPTEFALGQNYPNPFNPVTVIQYAVPSTQYVSLKVYNVLGQEVAVLVNGVNTPGVYSATWDASKVTSGVYYYRLAAGSFTSVKKMLLAK